MKRLYKYASIILVFTLLLAQLAFADTKDKLEFTDLNESYWAYGNIMKLVDAGIIVGYPDATFKPEGNITRAELVKIVNLIFEYSDKGEATTLSDVKAEEWYYNHVLVAQNVGYIIGFEDGTFRPNDDITREQLCKIIDSINNLVELPFEKIPADNVSAWAIEYVNRVLSNRIMSLDENSNFRATEKATRAETCDALAKFLIDDIEDNENVGGGSGGGTGSGPFDDEKDLYETMNTVIRRLNLGVIPNLTKDTQVSIVNDIIDNMEKYQSDSSYDYKSAAEKAYDKYKQLSETEQKELKDLIQLKNTTQDLLDLKDFFFPNM